MKPLTEAERLTLRNSVDQYHAALLATPADHPAREFLRSRHLGANTVEQFRLGFVDTPHVFEHSKFTGMLVIPNLLLDQFGEERPAGLKFRLLDHAGKGDHRPKYNMPYKQVVRLFNLRALSTASDTICVTEGEFDAMSVCSVGFPAIGIPGVSNWGGKTTKYRERLLQGFSRVVLCRDSDKAGAELVDAMESVDGLEVRSFLPYKDVNEFLAAEGGEALRARINGETEPDPSLVHGEEEEDGLDTEPRAAELDLS